MCATAPRPSSVPPLPALTPAPAAPPALSHSSTAFSSALPVFPSTSKSVIFSHRASAAIRSLSFSSAHARSIASTLAWCSRWRARSSSSIPASASASRVLVCNAAAEVELADEAVVVGTAKALVMMVVDATLCVFARGRARPLPFLSTDGA
ncbi:hypothetical protein C8F04DRAFT_1078892 [Mycena alexandri]|uniref:Uncharacterized protein n=1 Tax=Mycena alexandri TaxID=1745969 RepID=A0AAD6XB13_9AGAR|nr:hypothetical protein C8F04DRAFT_1078892 [Mycena alexandri]